jgi:SAM-dependent methyltransferase
MSMLVLQSKHEIDSARNDLRRMDVSFIDSLPRRLLRRLKLVSGIAVGDYIKSWDVLRTLEFIERCVEKKEPILDIGCYACEILPALHKRGYTQLVGVDLNPRIHKMPHGDGIRYEVSDFMKTRFPDASFRAITSISVIEHGFKQTPLLREMARLLSPGGYLIASFDYWPDKIDTTGTQFFGMDWQIFSKHDVLSLIESAASYGLAPFGSVATHANEKTVHCAGKRYTFAWLALRKTPT